MVQIVNFTPGTIFGMDSEKRIAVHELILEDPLLFFRECTPLLNVIFSFQQQCEIKHKRCC